MLIVRGHSDSSDSMPLLLLYCIMSASLLSCIKSTQKCKTSVVFL